MAVAFDAKVTSTTDVSAATSMTNTTLTVGGGSNRALIAFVGWNANAPPSGITVNWDSTGTPQAMTLITGSSVSGASNGDTIQLYGLVNPTPGNKTLAVNWTLALEAHLAAVSFTGVDQTGGATSFPHGTVKAETLATSGTISITSAIGNMVVAMFAQNAANFASTSGTTVSLDTTATGNFSIGTLYDNGAASVTCTSAWGGTSTDYIGDGCDIAAAVAAAAAPFPLLGQIWV